MHLCILTPLAVGYFIFTEYHYNFQTTIRERVHVNATSPVGLDVEFDISLPHVPCSLLNIDANDPTGQTQSLHLDRKHHVWKHRIRLNEGTQQYDYIGDWTKLELGSTLLKEEHLIQELEAKVNANNETVVSSDERKLAETTTTTTTTTMDGTDGWKPPRKDEGCGSCYGAGEEGECCNTCDDVKRAYHRRGWHLSKPEGVEQCRKEAELEQEEGEGEGCNVHGIVALDTGGGSFHLAPGRSMESDSVKEDGMDVLSIFDILMKTFEQWNVSHTVHKVRFGEEYPGHVHQLDGAKRTIGDTYGMYQYYFQVRYWFSLGKSVFFGEGSMSTVTCVPHPCLFCFFPSLTVPLPYDAILDCAHSIPIFERHGHPNKSIQCDGTLATRKSWWWSWIAGRLFLL